MVLALRGFWLWFWLWFGLGLGLGRFSFGVVFPVRVHLLVTSAVAAASALRPALPLQRPFRGRARGAPLGPGLRLRQRRERAAGELDDAAGRLGLERRADARLGRRHGAVRQRPERRRHEAGFLLLLLLFLLRHVFILLRSGLLPSRRVGLGEEGRDLAVSEERVCRPDRLRMEESVLGPPLARSKVHLLGNMGRPDLFFWGFRRHRAVGWGGWGSCFRSALALAGVPSRRK